ncbi:MAG: peptidase M13 [Bifidobacteriaceae bacterium]|jgi:putative endopeptidase|nr:peptidase M13 [Bifidobacteriaceae bacterium]
MTHGDPSIRPQDDLFGHFNGGWLSRFEMPADRSADGAFRELFDAAESQVHQLIQACSAALAAGQADNDQQLIGALFASFMDEQRISQLGNQVLNSDFDLVDEATDHQSLAGVLGQLERLGIGGLLSSWVDTDPANPERYAVFLSQAGIGLPDESYYREEQFSQIRELYRQHISRLLGLVWPDDRPALPPDAAPRIWQVEAALAKDHWDVVATRDELKSFNPMTLSQLSARAKQFDWSAWATGLGAPPAVLEHLIVRQPSFVEALGQHWANISLTDWKLWAYWRIIRARVGLLSEEIVQANFEFWGPVISGAQEVRTRWKRGVSMVESVLGEAVGKLYVAKHFPPEAKAEVSAIVEHLLAAYRQSISNLSWMGEETRQRALAKLALFTPKIGYPNRWRDYSKLQLDPTDLVGNARAAAAFETDRELAKALGPVDRDEWFMTPQTVNAYYNPGMNEIVFPAAILQPPFYTAGGDQASNYGGIGAVIGHEIGHGFDDQGSQYDGAGRLVDWWTETDRAEFERRTKALIDQYNAYTPRQLANNPNAPHVNGELTIGENIGDLGGLAIAWLAYQLSGAVADDAAARRFFAGWAASWRTVVRDEEEIRRLTTDPHSPAEFRCNGVARNLDIFYQAFDVNESDALYLPPEQRVSIW